MRATRRIILATGAAMSLGCSINITNSDRDLEFEVSEPFLAELDASAHVRIRLEGINGTVIIRGDAETSVARIEAVRRVRSDTRADAQEFLERVAVDVVEQGDAIVVRTIQPNNTSGREVIVDYDLTIPAELAVDATNVNGAATVQDLVGDVEVTLVNGNIECDVTPSPGGLVDLTVVNGIVELDVPSSVSAKLEADVVNGTISVVGLTVFDATTSTRSVHGTLGAGDGLIDLGATNGTITVRGR